MWGREKLGRWGTEWKEMSFAGIFFKRVQSLDPSRHPEIAIPCSPPPAALLFWEAPSNIFDVTYGVGASLNSLSDLMKMEPRSHCKARLPLEITAWLITGYLQTQKQWFPALLRDCDQEGKCFFYRLGLHKMWRAVHALSFSCLMTTALLFCKKKRKEKRLKGDHKYLNSTHCSSF